MGRMLQASYVDGVDIETFPSSEIVFVSSQSCTFWTSVWGSQESFKSQRFSWLDVVGNLKPSGMFTLGLLDSSWSL